MREFDSEWSGARIVFGAGAASRIAGEVDDLGCSRVLIVCSPGRRNVDALRARLGERVVAVCDRAVQHVPESSVVEALAAVRSARADCVLAVGGGAAIGLAKAAALEADVVVAAVPTTYSGSEMTPIYGVTRLDGKTTGRSERVRPRLVLYDSRLTLDLPLALSLCGLFNAMAHAIEALYARVVEPVVADTAKQAIASLARAIERLHAAPTDLDARDEALYGAHLAGACLANSELALHHKICHVLGGSFGLPHAETHTAVLPHAVHFNSDSAPTAIAAVAEALSVSCAAEGIFDLASRVGCTMSLSALGLSEEDVGSAAELTCTKPYPNPRPYGADEIRELLVAAHAGRRPAR